MSKAVKFYRVWEPVDSKIFKLYAYDPETKTLDVQFHNGKIYRYEKVPPIAFAQMACAASTGAAYNQYIKGQYESRLTRKKSL